MMLLMLIGYLMCNVLLAWAMLQQPYLSKTLSHPHHKIQIIGCIQLFLSQQPKIQLTHSLYKVTLFLDFQPFV